MSCVTLDSPGPYGDLWCLIDFGFLVPFERLMKAVNTFPSKMHEHPEFCM